ncbi:MAG: hypothetical protein IH905_09040 [Proteobacteria bacterium]|nr:hypothetical protein [Pseudomonadota bacterium]
MDQPKKRLWIRAPLTEEEEASGQMYYSEGSIKSILQTFKPRSDLDRDEFVRRLENAAWWFVNLAAAGKAKPPSTLQRKWEQRARKIEGLLADFGQMSGRERGDLEWAAEQLAQRTGALPDLAPDRIELPPVPGTEPSPSDYTTVWPVAEQIEKSLAAIRWLCECVTEAALWAKYQKATPGNRPIEEKHDFYRAVARIYEEAAEDPRNPQKDRINGGWSGEVLDMLQACLQPLGVLDSKSIIYETYYRAGAKLIKGHWWEHLPLNLS